MKGQKYEKEWLEKTCAICCSYAEVLRKRGIKPSGGNYTTLKSYIQEYNIDISHFTGKAWNKGRTHKEDKRIQVIPKYTTDEQILTKNSSVRRKQVKNYILRNDILEYKCEMCGNTEEWFDKQISLELDHKDGDESNNELSNLRFLCPNCHATTETYRGKNIKKITKI